MTYVNGGFCLALVEVHAHESDPRDSLAAGRSLRKGLGAKSRYQYLGSG